MTILRASISYWAAIFALGFALGTVRVVWGASAVGETTFILIEVPVMLVASWFAARWLVRRYSVRTFGDAALMGGLSYIMLLGAELALATGLLNQSPGEWFSSLWLAPNYIGTLGQVTFGLMPLAVRGR